MHRPFEATKRIVWYKAFAKHHLLSAMLEAKNVVCNCCDSWHWDELILNEKLVLQVATTWTTKGPNSGAGDFKRNDQQSYGCFQK